MAAFPQLVAQPLEHEVEQVCSAIRPIEDATGESARRIGDQAIEFERQRRFDQDAQHPVILCDHLAEEGKRLAFAASPDVPKAVVQRLVATLTAQAIAATRLPDWPGLVGLRTIAMLANEGFEAVMQGVADETGVDNAMRFGVNYPKGPIAWAREIGLDRILSTLDAIHALTGDPRYRASMALRMAAEA